MDDLRRIPCVLMRGGTSKGPFFLASDLPIDPAQRDELLIEVMGSGHPLEIDGVGGGNSLSSKVAIIGPATRDGADVDYLFAQVKVEERLVDTSPNCGNMLSAVGPFAIEAGLVPAGGQETTVRVHNVNTGTIIEAVIQTPGGTVRYQGTPPSTACPVPRRRFTSPSPRRWAPRPAGSFPPAPLRKSSTACRSRWSTGQPR